MLNEIGMAQKSFCICIELRAFCVCVCCIQLKMSRLVKFVIWVFAQSVNIYTNCNTSNSAIETVFHWKWLQPHTQLRTPKQQSTKCFKCTCNGRNTTSLGYLFSRCSINIYGCHKVRINNTTIWSFKWPIHLPKCGKQCAWSIVSLPLLLLCQRIGKRLFYFG